MSKQIVSVVACTIIFVAALSSCYGATVAPICKPGIIEDMPPHIKKVCLALENSDQLASALESYINNEAAGMYLKLKYLYKIRNKKIPLI